jgi:hypothetical protein
MKKARAPFFDPDARALEGRFVMGSSKENIIELVRPQLREQVPLAGPFSDSESLHSYERCRRFALRLTMFAHDVSVPARLHERVGRLAAVMLLTKLSKSKAEWAALVEAALGMELGETK